MTLFKKYIPHILIVLSVWVVYGNTLSHQFAADDNIVLLENERVQAGMSDLLSLFKNIKSEQTQHRYGYRPITLLSFALEVELFGLNPLWLHFGNLVFYSFLCLLVYLLLKRVFSSTNDWLLVFITLLFAVHPLHTEVVANIKSRDEILAMLFGIAYLVQLWKWNYEDKSKHLIFASLFAVLAFLSKENALGYAIFGLTLPIFLDERSLGQKIKKALSPLLIFITLIAIYSLSQFFLEENSLELAQKGLYHEDRYAANPLVDEGIYLRVINAFMLILLGLKLFIIPHPLIHDYGTQMIRIADSMLDYRVLLGILIMGVMTFTAIKFRKQKPQLLFGFLFFIGSLAIYLHVPLAGPDIFGERFLFGPLLGLAIIFVSILELLPLKWCYAIMSLSILLLGGLSIKRSQAWENTEVLFETDKEHLDSCARFQYNYASLLHLKFYDAAPRQQNELKEKILFHYEKSIDLTDRILKVYLDLGSAYMEFGYPEKALKTFQDCADNYNHLSPPFFVLGKYYMSKGNYDLAKQNLELAIERGEVNANFYFLKAVCEVKLNDLKSAYETLLRGEQFSESVEGYQELMRKIEAAEQ